MLFQQREKDLDLQFRDVDEHVQKFVDLRKKLDAVVKKNVDTAQARQKKQYDAKHLPGSYKVGGRVLVKNMKISKKGDKLKPNWTGPYEIAECLGTNSYRLQKQLGKKKVVLKSMYNSTRLKKYHERRGMYNVTILIW